MELTHTPCGGLLHAQVRCSECQGVLKAHEVHFTLDGENIGPTREDPGQNPGRGEHRPHPGGSRPKLSPGVTGALWPIAAIHGSCF
jgi:hypothetical protein